VSCRRASTLTAIDARPKMVRIDNRIAEQMRDPLSDSAHP